MRPRLWSCEELVDALTVPGEPDLAGQMVAVAPPDTSPDRDAAEPDRLGAARQRLRSLPCAIVASGDWPRRHGALDLVDTVAGSDDELDEIATAFARTPIAASALALHLRATEDRSVPDGLVAESALYSTLQAGPEHRAWRAATPRRGRPDDKPPRVRVERVDTQLQVTLQRPGVRNALDAAMRDELLAALAIAEADPDLTVVVRGDGPAFCSGGDLDEFGSTPDPATAHVIRLRRSIGAAINRIAPRVTVEVHGPSAGSGVELAAFAGLVRAHRDATFVLPELGLGLIPGAGGTISLPSRIGRHRTAWLALTGRPIDADVALAWGLVDEIMVI